MIDWPFSYILDTSGSGAHNFDQTMWSRDNNITAEKKRNMRHAASEFLNSWRCILEWYRTHFGVTDDDDHRSVALVTGTSKRDPTHWAVWTRPRIETRNSCLSSKIRYRISPPSVQWFLLTLPTHRRKVWITSDPHDRYLGHEMESCTVCNRARR